MKLQNNQTGQVENFCIDKDQICSCDRAFVYDSLTQLQEAGWEDYKEPKWGYIIDTMDEDGYSRDDACFDDAERQKAKELGIWFETKEEAEKAVEKLKAWKRLKDKGFRFEEWKRDKKYCGDLTIEATDQISCDFKDLDLLFGGEE